MENFIPLKALRLAISAGAPLSAEVATKFFNKHGIKIHNFYGSSETGGITYDRTGNATLSGRNIGKPLIGVKVTVTKDSRVKVKSKAVIGGSIILSDLGALNKQRELQLLGRADLIANLGGKKVWPAEIETVLRKIPDVSDAWVSVKKQTNSSDILVAAIETRFTQTEIEQELSKKLPTWKLPKRYIIQNTLPRTDRGKLNVPELKKLFNFSN